MFGAIMKALFGDGSVVKDGGVPTISQKTYEGPSEFRFFSLTSPFRASMGFMSGDELAVVKESADYCFLPKIKFKEQSTYADNPIFHLYDDFRKKEYYPLLQGFVKKYGDKNESVFYLVDSVNVEGTILEEDEREEVEFYLNKFNQFKELLVSKEIVCNDSECLALIIPEIAEQEYQEFKRKILSNSPEGLIDYVSNFSSVCSESIEALYEKVQYIASDETGFYKDVHTGEYYDDGSPVTTQTRYVPKSLPVQLDYSDMNHLFVGRTVDTGTSTYQAFNIFGYVLEFAHDYYFFKRLLKSKNIDLLNSDGSTITVEQIVENSLSTANSSKVDSFEQMLLNDDVVSINDVDSMNGIEFEKFLSNLFAKRNYDVLETKQTGDQGADLVIKRNGETTVVQAKRYESNIGNSAVQEVVASISHYKADKGMVVTNSNFTVSAKTLAESNKIELVDRDQLKQWIQDYL